MLEKIEFLENYLPHLRKQLLAYPITEIATKSKFDDIVTDVDIYIQNQLITTLQTQFLDTTFLAEEKGQFELSDKLWIIDPIDGTKNFVRKHEDYAISIAYYENLKPIFGIVYDIVNDLMYVAIKGKGAFLNGKKLAQRPQISLNEAIIDVNLNTIYFYRDKHQMDLKKLNQQSFAHRCYGSAALSLCRIALGTHDVYLNNHLSIWDFAAAQIVLEEVGGVVEFPFHLTSLLVPQSVTLNAASSMPLLKDVQSMMKQ